MTKTKKYKYIGRNGILVTRIQLDGIHFIPMVELKAGDGKILTNGNVTARIITVEESEISEWREILDTTAKDE